MVAKKAEKPVFVDYPVPQERIASPNYTFRIGSLVQGPVELSIDGGEWKPCRHAVGYWWYDWSCEKPGRHKAVARVKTPEAEEKTLVRYFHVGAPKAKRATVSGRSSKKPSRKKGA